MFLNEQDNWAAGIYQLEEIDPVRGGDPATTGISNRQGQELASRTKYLYNRLQAFTDINLVLINADSAIAYPDIMNKLLLIGVNAAGKTLTIDAAAMPVGAYQKVTIGDDANPTAKKPVKIAIANMSIYGAHSYITTHVWMYPGESITFVKMDNSNCQIIDSNKDFSSVADIVYKAVFATSMPGMVEAKGQLVNRADYPRLWELIANVAIPDGSWLLDPAYSGRFSYGNGTTTFRLPDLRGVFIRGLDGGRGIDPNRGTSSPNQVGSYIKAMLRAHNHKLFSYTTIIQNSAGSTNNQIRIPVIEPIGTIAFPPTVQATYDSNFNAVDNENAPASTAYLAFLKY